MGNRIPIFLLGLILLLFAAACGGRSPASDWKFGEALAIRVPEKATVQQVAYTSSAIVRGELLGTATSTQTIFGPAATLSLLPGSEVVRAGGEVQTRTKDYTVDYETGMVTFVNAPEAGDEVTIDYTPAIRGESLGAPTGTETTLGPTATLPILPGSEIVRVDGAVQTRGVDYTIDYETGMVTFARAPTAGDVTIDYQGAAHFVVRPTEEGNSLYLARIILVNTRSQFESLRVSDVSVQLLGELNVEWPALDPFAQGRDVETSPPDIDKYVPFVWGNFELLQDFQLEGWLLFDLPSGTEPRGMRWDTGDTILLDF